MNSAEYLAQLKQHLTKKTSDEFASDCIRELEGHLLAAHSAYVELGEKPAVADRRAILDQWLTEHAVAPGDKPVFQRGR